MNESNAHINTTNVNGESAAICLPSTPHNGIEWNVYDEFKFTTKIQAFAKLRICEEKKRKILQLN